LLQLLITLTNIGGHFISILFGLDWSAKEQFSLRIFCGKYFFSIHIFQLHLAFIVRKNDLRLAEVDPCSLQCAVVFAQNANFPRGAAGVFPCLSCRLMSFHHCSTDHAPLCPELLLQLFFQTLHLFAEITCVIKIPVRFVFISRRPGMALRSFFL
jgi:hypothetical protein